MEVLSFTRTRNTKDALDVLDSLKQAVESGEVVAFAAVGIEPGDETRMWASCTESVTRLRMLGAISSLGWHYNAGE